MKKFLVVLLAIFFSSISLAHMGHYNKFDKIEMEILRNNEVIGYNNYFFERDGETTTVKNQYKFEVKLLSFKENTNKNQIKRFIFMEAKLNFDFKTPLSKYLDKNK